MNNIDRLIAQKVMGFVVVEDLVNYRGFQLHKDGYSGKDLPHYSTHIKAAWEVVEKLAEMGYDVIVSRVRYGRDKYECCLTRDDWPDDDRICKGANTAPMAICLAALKVEVRRDG